MESNMSYEVLKQHILASLDISSGNLDVISDAFSKLYIEFQTEVVNEVTVKPIAGTCFKWVYTKDCDANKALIFFHGGGYTMGDTQDHLELIARFVLQTKIKILSVDYRLVPKSIFPAPLEDAFSAYNWLLAV